MFTAKHFVCLADVIHQARVKAQDFNPAQGELFDKNTALQTLADLTVDLINLFKQDNPKFDQFKFIEACNKDLAGP